MPTQPCGVGIVGMGYGVPDAVRTNDWWPASWRAEHEARLAADVVGSVEKAAQRGAADVDPEVARHAGPYLRDLFRGTRERRVLEDGLAPSDIEARACVAALADAGVDPAEVDLVLGSSLVPDYAILGNQALVAHKIGLRRDVAVMDVDGGCTSLVHQIRVASRLVQTGEARVALVYVSAMVSRVTDYSQPSSVMVGDGAVAAVIRRVADGFGYVAASTTTIGEMHAGIRCVPRSAPETPWYATDRMHEPMTVQRVDARAAHAAGVRSASLFRETTARLFAATGYGPEDVAYLAVSQAGAWFGRAMADAIGIPHARLLPPSDQFERFGHMMQASVAMNLLQGWRTGRLRAGDLALIYSPGVGFTTAAALVRWSKDP